MRAFANTSSKVAFLAAVLCSLHFVSQAQLAYAADCDVFVRLISAHSDGVNADAAKAKGVAPMRARVMPAKLEDVAAQLAPLPFDQYQTLDASRATVAFAEQGMFRLNQDGKGTHVVRVLPHQVSGGKVHLTVDWIDHKGDSLVSTMLRVMNGDNVMLGAEGASKGASKGCSLVGVRVNCRAKR